jgi:hypothetical protein
VIEAYGVGALGVAVLAAGWLAVQLAWRRSFGFEDSEADGLASRGCAGCAHIERCEDRLTDEGDAP